jgi:dihydrofolate synthase/folylpolyglutamate synthase
MALSYQQALDYIHSFDDPYLAAIRDQGKQTWGLERLRVFLHKLGDPHLAYPTIHVAGTKGKGSTAAFITQGLIESGLKTGLYTSPHLQDWRERIQVNRRLIAKQALAHLVEDFKPQVDDPAALTAFEVTTALAFWHFSREDCDAAVIEVGLGGRLDATSVVEPIVSVITNISYDHMQLLGNTLEEIAAEKAAIIKPGVPVISAPQELAALDVITQQANRQNSHLTLVGRDWHTDTTSISWEGSHTLIGADDHRQPYTIGLPGIFQIENAAVALATLHETRRAGLPVTDQGMKDGLAKVQWPGRLEIVGRDPLVVIDSAHNQRSMQELVASLNALAGDKALTAVFGCMADKDIDALLEALLPATRRLVLTRIDHPRAASLDELKQRAQRVKDGASQAGEAWTHTLEIVALERDIEAALQIALEHTPADQLICVTGSLAMAGHARRAWLAGSGLEI